jgi:Spy/CpxP family protein refolding chaperone
MSTWLLFLFLFLRALAAYAQDIPLDGGPPPGFPMQQESPKDAAAKELKELSKKLKLTETQKTSIRPIVEDQHERMSALFQNQFGSMKDNMQKMMAIQDEANSKVRGLLTDEQQPQFDKLVQRMKQRIPPPPDMGPN